MAVIQCEGVTTMLIAASDPRQFAPRVGVGGNERAFGGNESRRQPRRMCGTSTGGAKITSEAWGCHWIGSPMTSQ